MRRTSLPEVRFFRPHTRAVSPPGSVFKGNGLPPEERRNPAPPDDFYRRSVANDRMCQVMPAATASSDACAHGHASTTAKTQ